MEAICHTSKYDNEKSYKGEIKEDFNGLIKRVEELRNISPEMKKHYETIIKEISNIRNKIFNSFKENTDFTDESIEKILQRKYIVFVRSFDNKGQFLGLGVAESISITGEQILVSAGHVTGGGSQKRVFGGEVIAVYNMKGEKMPITEVYKDTHTDLGFIKIGKELKESYNLDPIENKEVGKKIMSTGSVSNPIIKKVISDEIGFLSKILIPFREDDIDTTKQNIIPNIVNPGDSGSMIITNDGNPYCIAQGVIPGYIYGKLASFCGGMPTVRKSYYNYKLLSLEKECEK